MPPEQRIQELEAQVSELQDLRQEVDFLFGRLEEQRAESLNRLSSPQEKEDASEVVYEVLSDYFFEQVNFTSLLFSQIEDGGSSGTTSTSNFIGVSRITDTSEGRLHEVGNKSKTRLSVYFNNPDSMEGYVLSPAVFDSFASLNSFSSMDTLRSYVGLKMDQGTLSVAIKQAGEEEELYPTGITLDTSGVTDTYVLEIVYSGNTSSIYLNGSLIDVFSTNFELPNTDTQSFLPLLAPGRSTDGSNINIVVENFQFLQDRE